VTWAHRRWRGLSESWTKRVVDDRRDFGAEVDHDDMDILVERTNPISWSCCMVIPRAVWDDLGGFDERFRGWGFEDMALQSIVVGLYGHERIDGDVYHLWHPRSEERIGRRQPALTATPSTSRTPGSAGATWSRSDATTGSTTGQPNPMRPTWRATWRT
jgi:hypothetical protein